MGEAAMAQANLLVPAFTLAAIWTLSLYLAPSDAFIPNYGQQGHQLADSPSLNTPQMKTSSFSARPAAGLGSLKEAVGTSGVFAYGLGFGLLAAVVRSASNKVARRAESVGIAVKEKAPDGSDIVPYLEDVPRSLYEKRTVQAILNMTPKDQWEDPPEDTPLWMLKQYAETYGSGPGKASKMSWWDYFYLKSNELDPEALEDVGNVDEVYKKALTKYSKDGTAAVFVPGPSGFFWIGGGMRTKWRGREYFAGDQVQTWMTSSGFARQYLGNWAFYRKGLQPWQRGLEIGLAHGYFLVGPFKSAGPLRDTPEAATVALICAAAVIGIVSSGGLLFGAVEKPTMFDREGEPKGSGFQEMINWHAFGALGGAGFAHALLTIMG